MAKRNKTPYRDLDASDTQHSNPTSERLRFAIRAAGGNNTISEMSGVPLSTLGRYLAGHEMKLQSATALANACGVTLEWLATGVGEPPQARNGPSLTMLQVLGIEPSDFYSRGGLSAGQVNLQPPSHPMIDVEALAKALEIVDILSSAPGQPTSYLAKAKRVMQNYDLLTMPEADVPPLPHLPNKDPEE